ncbi:hypothetical protein [Ancylobacter dichloromethanicus]|uniref:Uncharacterized protein n=2 Tax=Ancylobacter dichloromethanicus TaxID=518825 RepID=A0A9W6JET3_9HYPH|nr:hypothetical protein [Ancylobacter dichloromethanicus]GLK74495.1 hypothetical protein GCM10017643_46130 [Ancylobacter dichloromethanicus]
MQIGAFDDTPLSDHEWDALLAIGVGDETLPLDLASLSRLEERGLIVHRDISYDLTTDGRALYDQRWPSSQAS